MLSVLMCGLLCGAAWGTDEPVGEAVTEPAAPPPVEAETAMAAATPTPEAAAAEMTDTDILLTADKARGNLGGVSWRVTIESLENGRTSTKTLDVKARGFDVLAETAAPRKYKGHKLLMRDGAMWFHKPDLSKPAPISQRQKLMGTAAYGDIAATNYGKDYEPTRLPDEDVNGEACYVFDLKARTKKATYDRVKYWVSKERLVGVQAEYYTVSGKMFKSSDMVYENQVTGEDGEPQLFISRMDIADEVTAGDTTSMSFAEPSLETIPPGVFDINLLMR
jgi:outer membrane lipoprotein-sorting protein